MSAADLYEIHLKVGMMQDEQTSQERLSAVERDVQHLSQAIVSLRHDVNEGIASLRRALSETKTPVTAMASWAGVVILLVGAVLWPQIQADNRHDAILTKLSDTFVAHVKDGHPYRVEEQAKRNRDDIDKLRIALESHEKSSGHPTAIAQFERLEHGLERLDDTLQREMRILDQLQTEKIESVDNSLRQEMRLLDQIQDAAAGSVDAARLERIDSLMNTVAESMSSDDRANGSLKP